MSIQTRTENGVAHIGIARPEKKNALSAAMYGELAQAFRAAEAADDVRAILLHGDRSIFTSGNDIKDFAQRSDTAPAESPARAFMVALTGAAKPVVVAVNGAAIGIGTTLLLHCDLIYLADDAVLKMPFVNLGLCPEFGSSLVLPAIAGHARAAEKLLLGEPIAPDEAVAMGMATRVVPADEVFAFARTQAERLAQLPPQAVQASKRLMRAAGAPALAAHIEIELKAFQERLASNEAKEAFAAFLERRAPDFSKT